LQPAGVALRFVAAINRRDLGALASLMSRDHRLEVYDEEPLVGKDANVDAWRGYFDSFPAYVIHPQQVAIDDDTISILGYTTGSHLRLPDDEERELPVVWIADIQGATVTRWKLVEDSVGTRHALGLGIGDE
jgi:hypothetical protein